LIEQIDIDSAELNIKIAHVASIIACRSDMWVLAMYMSDNPTIRPSGIELVRETSAFVVTGWQPARRA
jgi:hypothetical protein